MMRRFSYFSVLLIIGLLVLTACGGSIQSTSSSSDHEAMLPEYAQNAPPRVKEAYLYAVAHQEELAKYPCFCGCGSMGHTSNLSCYIEDVSADGTVTFDNHASGCGICVDITQDVMRLKAEGKTSPEVRTYVDAQYGAFGPSTDTAFPTE